MLMTISLIRIACTGEIGTPHLMIQRAGTQYTHRVRVPRQYRKPCLRLLAEYTAVDSSEHAIDTKNTLKSTAADPSMWTDRDQAFGVAALHQLHCVVRMPFQPLA